MQFRSDAIRCRLRAQAGSAPPAESVALKRGVYTKVETALLERMLQDPSIETGIALTDLLKKAFLPPACAIQCPPRRRRPALLRPASLARRFGASTAVPRAC